MPKLQRVPANNGPICPHCQRELSFLSSWTYRGLWGYNEVRTYECSEHGPIFVSPEIAVGHDPAKQPDNGPDDDDRNSHVSAPRKPTSPLNADAIAVPEPDSTELTRRSGLGARARDSVASPARRRATPPSGIRTPRTGSPAIRRRRSPCSAATAADCRSHTIAARSSGRALLRPGR